jgi:hypothetical protein
LFITSWRKWWRRLFNWRYPKVELQNSFFNTPDGCRSDIDIPINRPQNLGSNCNGENMSPRSPHTFLCSPIYHNVAHVQSGSSFRSILNVCVCKISNMSVQPKTQYYKLSYESDPNITPKTSTPSSPKHPPSSKQESIWRWWR